MKKYVAVLAATAVLGVTSAFAAHPFSDVTAQDWAYQAVERLAAEGVIEGYPDGTFKGQRNITRYEMAQMIARADAHKDEVTAEQKATIQRLAVEFANELQAFGVRVNKLEDQVGNFKFSGDVRVRYNNNTTDSQFMNDSMFRYRARVRFDGTVNENTKASVRLSTGYTKFSEDGQSGTSVDEVYVKHTFSPSVQAKLGRQDLFVGNGLAYDARFDGLVVHAGGKTLSADVSYGQIEDNGKKSVSIYQVNYNPSEHIAVKGFYLDRHGVKHNGYTTKPATDIFGGSVDFTLGRDHKIWLGGEYLRKAGQGASGEAWTAGIGYGKADISKPGTWGVKGQYFDLGKETFVKFSTWNTPLHEGEYGNKDVRANYKGWLVTGEYTLAKNLGLSAYIALDNKRKVQEKSDQPINLPNYYLVDLTYQF